MFKNPRKAGIVDADRTIFFPNFGSPLPMSNTEPQKKLAFPFFWVMGVMELTELWDLRKVGELLPILRAAPRQCNVGDIAILEHIQKEALAKGGGGDFFETKATYRYGRG